MKAFWLIAALIGCVAALFTACEKRSKNPPAQDTLAQPPQAKETLPAAEFIFRGVVKVTGSSQELEDGEGRAVVAVEEVLKAPEALAGMAEPVTVKLKDPRGVKAGDKRVFFTRVDALGESISVTELASMDEQKAGDPAALKARIAREDAERAQVELKRKVGTMDKVVRAKVVGLGPSPPWQASEHDPRWQEAKLELTETFKGPAEKNLSVMFPSSDDLMWADAPKLKPGMEGIYFLSKPRTPEAPKERLVVQERGDYVPPDREKDVLPILKSIK